MAQEENIQEEEQGTGRIIRSPRFKRMNNTSSDEVDEVARKPKRTSVLSGTVSTTVFIICLTIAIFGDLAGGLFNLLLPGLGGLVSTIIITPIGAVNTFALNWGSGRKVTGKSLGIIIGCVAIECIPILNALPGLTASVILTKISHKADDFTKNY